MNGRWPRRGGDWPGDLGDAADRAREGLRRLRPRGFVLGVIVVIVVILLWSSWYTVQPEETAVVLRFGRFVGTAGPGLHFKIPYGVDTVRLVPTERVLKEEFGFRTVSPGRRTQYAKSQLAQESLMLTGDLNVIDVEWIVQFRIAEPEKFLFNVREPRETIRDLTEAIMRRVVGNRLGSDVLTVGRVGVASEVLAEMQKVLNAYETGIKLVTVELQDVTPPAPVQPAYNEVNKSLQDKERMINEAQAQANREIPRAKGEALRTVNQARGYALERVNAAKGEAERFRSVLAEYSQARDVTRQRLYLEAMSELLAEAKALYIVDGDQKALLPFLAVDGGTPGAVPGGGQR